MGRYIDFKFLKENVSIEQAMVFLHLKDFTAEDGRYRGECPRCKAGSRSLELIPETESYRCHSAKAYGDVISFVAHVHGTSMKEAAGWLEDKLARKEEKAAKPEPKAAPKTAPEPHQETRGFAPLKDLKYEHEKVQALGLSAEDAERMGIGYCTRGYYKGYVVAPIRTDTGHLVVYAIISTEKRMPETLHWPDTNVIPIKRRA